jgi:pimeloyl-ACP methyl ester carboxylesterase
VIYAFDRFQVDTTAFEVTRDAERLTAQPQVIELLIFLLQHRDRVVSRDEIFDEVWNGRAVSDAALSSRIKSLRQLLGDDGEAQKFIRTIHGRGFRFVGNAGATDPAAADHPVDDKPATPIERPRTRYAKSGDVHIAYQVFGDGPVNLVIAPGFVSHIENYWDSPAFAAWLADLGRHATVTLFDKRGTGLSDSVAALPGMDERMDDVRAVMDAVGLERAFIMGISEGGSLAALFAATYPQRCQGLILYGAFARFTSWFPTAEALQGLFDYIETAWGTGQSLPLFAPTVGDDPDFIEWWGRFERLGATPGAAIALMTMNSAIDISQILQTIQVPALVIHRTEDVLIDFEAGQYLAAEIPNAQLVALPGRDHLPWAGDNIEGITAAIGDFLAGEPITTVPDTVLTTVLCVQLRETGRRDGAGTGEWRAAANDAISHRLRRFRAREIAPRKECRLALFDGPARALHCALDIAKALSKNQLSAGLGVHTGEVRLIDEIVSGRPLDQAIEIAGLSEDSQVLVTGTVKDLTAGSGLRIEAAATPAADVAADARGLFRIDRS